MRGADVLTERGYLRVPVKYDELDTSKVVRRLSSLETLGDGRIEERASGGSSRGG